MHAQHELKLYAPKINFLWLFRYLNDVYDFE